MKNLTRLRKFDLSDSTFITEEVFISILKGMKHFPKLQILDLSHNLIAIDEERTNELIDIFNVSPTLQIVFPHNIRTREFVLLEKRSKCWSPLISSISKTSNETLCQTWIREGLMKCPYITHP